MFIKVRDVIVDVRTIKMINISGKVIRIHGDFGVNVVYDSEEDAKQEFEKIYNRLKAKW